VNLRVTPLPAGSYPIPQKAGFKRSARAFRQTQEERRKRGEDKAGVFDLEKKTEMKREREIITKKGNVRICFGEESGKKIWK